MARSKKATSSKAVSSKSKTDGKSKTDLIREFLAANPNATGKEAGEALNKHGISTQYFYTIKSNLARRQKIGGVSRSVRRPLPGSGPQPTLQELQSVADFARDIGGLDKLNSAVSALRQVQMDSV